MPVRISGDEYFTLNEVCRHAGISRQTLWRWRQEDKVPPGRRLRGRQLLFALQEVAEIERYATHLEPAVPRRANQMRLFDTHSNRRGA